MRHRRARPVHRVPQRAQRDSRLVEMYLFVALVYFVLCYALSFVVKLLQKRIAIVR